MSGFWLKMIALVTMIIDHTGAVIFPEQMWMRMVGRIAFPLYIFLMAQGIQHTKSLKNYALRMLLFAAISEIPYDLALRYTSFPAVVEFGGQNVFFTLALGVLAVGLQRWLQKKNLPAFVSYMAVIPCMLAAIALRTDYHLWGVLALFLCAQMRSKPLQIAAVLAFIMVQYRLSEFALCAALALVFIAFYNGKRGPKVRIAFYAAYPGHLMLLYIIRLLLAV